MERLFIKNIFMWALLLIPPHGLMVPKIRTSIKWALKRLVAPLKKLVGYVEISKLTKKEFFWWFNDYIELGRYWRNFLYSIINPPEVAILGIGKSFDKLIKIKDKFVSRKILPISLSYDHRIIDGAEGARFCVYLGQCLGRDFAFKLAV